MIEIGNLAARLMESVAEEFGDEAQINTVAIVAEIDAPTHTTFRVICNDDRIWMQRAFLAQARDCLEDWAAGQESWEDEE